MTDRIEKTIDLQAPIDRVWRAITDYEEFGTWFRVKLDGPFVLGGVNTGHITHSGCEHMHWRSTVERMDEPHLFAFSWPNPEDPSDAAALEHAPTLLVEFRLETIETGTRLTITESGFDALPPGHRSKALRVNEHGWDLQTGYIRAHVEK